MRLIYITTSGKEEAKKIGAELVANKLCACVNIIDGMESMYWWKGKVETDKECILIAKTAKHNVEELTEKVKEIHSYEVPCVISIPFSDNEGNSDYLNWLKDSIQ